MKVFNFNEAGSESPPYLTFRFEIFSLPYLLDANSYLLTGPDLSSSFCPFISLFLN